MYIVIPDTSPDHEFATYTNQSGNFFIIRETTAANPTVGGAAILTTDISGYTLLPTIVAQQAAALQRIKDNAIKQVTNTLETELAAGVVVSSDSLKVKEWKITRREKLDPASEAKVGSSNSVVLNASSDDLIAFTQGAALIATAAATIPDQTTFNAMSVSTVLGRPIIDSQGNAIDLTVDQFRQLLVAFGGIVGAKQAVLVSKIAQINAATTAADVNTIVGS